MTKRSSITLLVFAALFILYGYRLWYPQDIYYDEVYHVQTARQFLTFSGNYDNTHPPLGKMMMAASIKVFGDKSWAWRLFPFLSGIAIFVVFYRLAARYLKNEYWALVAVVLFALDGITITQARIAMLNPMMLLWMLLAVFFFARIVESKTVKKRDLAGCGLALGLTAATRWVGFGVVAILGMMYAANFKKLKFKVSYLQLGLFLVVLPIATYFAAHLILPFITGYKWSDLWTYQFGMYKYHAHLKEGHIYGSHWLGWPFLRRPIWYFFQNHSGMINGILCIANPALVWVLFPAMGYLTWRFFKKKDWMSALVVAGFLSQWMPWALISRVKFFHYFYTAMPFLALAVTKVLQDAWVHREPEKRPIVIAYLLLVLVMFAYWYPLLTGYPITEGYFQKHMWFKRWI